MRVLWCSAKKSGDVAAEMHFGVTDVDVAVLEDDNDTFEECDDMCECLVVVLW